MAKHQPSDKSSSKKKLKEETLPQTTQMIAHIAMPPAVPPMMSQIQFPQQLSVPDPTSSSTAISQDDLDLLLSCIAQIAYLPCGYVTEHVECIGNIPLIEELIQLPVQQTRDQGSNVPRKTNPEPTGLSEDEMDQTILAILTGEAAQSPAPHTSVFPHGQQPSAHFHTPSSGQPSPTSFSCEGQGQPSPSSFSCEGQVHFPSRQGSPIASTSHQAHTAYQPMLPVDPGYQQHRASREGQRSSPVGQGSYGPDYRFPVLDDSEVRYGIATNPGPSYSPSVSPRLAFTGMQEYRQEPGSTSQEGQPRLWKFILDLLEDPRYNPSLITWVSRPEGIFRLIDPPRLAEFWGHVKGNKSMNYEKLSRGLRYYYNHHVLEHVPGKLVYKFGPQAQVWQYLTQTSYPRPTTTATCPVTSQYPPHTSY